MFCVGIVSHITIAVKRPKAIVMEINNFKGIIVEAEVVAVEVFNANFVVNEDDDEDTDDTDVVDMFRGFRQTIWPKVFIKFGIIFYTQNKLRKQKVDCTFITLK